MPFAHDTMNATGRHSVLCQPVPPAPPADPANWFRTSVYGGIEAATGAAVQSAYADDYVVLVDSVIGVNQPVYPFVGEATNAQRAEFKLVAGGSAPTFYYYTPFAIFGPANSQRDLVIDLPGSTPYVSVGTNTEGGIPADVRLFGGGSARQTIDAVLCDGIVAEQISALRLTNLSIGTVLATGAEGTPGSDGSSYNNADGVGGNSGTAGVGEFLPTPGGNGANGGNADTGDNGGSGGDGGRSVANIYVDDCYISFLYAACGNGGVGGMGGSGGTAHGGAGGAGGNAEVGNTQYPNGANGGNGGNGGMGGNGGSGGAGGGVSTAITRLIGIGAASSSHIEHYWRTAYPGAGGSGALGGQASGGAGGAGGLTWSDNYGPVGTNGADGINGTDGTHGFNGVSGSSPGGNHQRTLIDPNNSLMMTHIY